MNLLIKILVISCLLLLVNCDAVSYRTEAIKAPTQAIEEKIQHIYTAAELEKNLSFALFRRAMIGFYNIKELQKKDKIAIVDFSQPSTKKRFYLIDIEQKKLVVNTWVAHGKNSGQTIPSSFSNQPNSKKSSLGFFITGETYNGKHGFSLRLDGLEKGINHNARKRAIVIHGADYVGKNYIKKHGRLGRSWGCPALSTDQSTQIIKKIANGYCLFIYAEDPFYLKNSKYLLNKD